MRRTTSLRAREGTLTIHARQGASMGDRRDPTAVDFGRRGRVGIVAFLLAWSLILPAVADDFVVRDDIVSDPNVDLLDPEFDSEEGLVVWQDLTGQMWLAQVDLVSGDLLPQDGRGELLDTGLAPIGFTGNGPEFGYGLEGPVIGYTRLIGLTRWLATATRDAQGTWRPRLQTNGADRYRPEGTPVENLGLNPARLVYVRNDETLGFVSSWRDLAGQEVEGTSTTGQGGRWLGRDFRFTAFQEVDGINQIVEVDAATGATRSVSTSPGLKGGAFNWYPPEFGGDLGVVGLIDFEALGVWRERAGEWELVSTFTVPSEKPFLSSPEAFVVNGRSYITLVAADVLAELFPGQPVGPSEIWITGLDPGQGFYRRIDDPLTVEQKSEPEPFVLTSEAVVYYTEKPEDSGIRLLRRAATGLEAQLQYGDLAYGGDWANGLRGPRNCACAPFDIPDTHLEVFTEDPGGIVPYRHATGADGNTYTPVQSLAGGTAFAALDALGAEAFRIDDATLGQQIAETSPLVDANGDIYIAAESAVTKLDAQGNVLWQTPTAGLARAPAFAPDGNLLLFTWNGWGYVIAPRTGDVLLERRLVQREVGETFSCVALDQPNLCIYLTAPVVNGKANRIYVTQNLGGGSSVLQAWRYIPAAGDGTAPALRRAWLGASPVIAGPASAPVASADGTRLYVQDGAGTLHAFAANDGTALWDFALGFSAADPPTVSAGGFLMPGGTGTSAPGYNRVSILEDLGDSAAWRLRLNDYAPASASAVGNDDRFVLAARRRATGELTLLSVDPGGQVRVSPWGEGAQTPAGLGSINLTANGGVTVTVAGSAPRLKRFTAGAPSPLDAPR
ncbi:MAG: PQQ-binding-like beta-propeller repeat protein [Pseudomonadota bacterium]